MELSLHPDFALWMDNQCARIATLARDLTESIPKVGDSFALHPDHPIKASLDLDSSVGEPILFLLNAAGAKVGRLYQHEGRVLGLIDGTMTEAHKLAERIWSKQELRDLISYETVLEALLECVGEIILGRPVTRLSDKIVETVRNGVRPLSVWVPIDDVDIEGELSFATTVLAPLSIKDFDAAWVVGTPAEALQAFPETASQMRERIRLEWLGRAIMRFTFEAEPKRARELAWERATIYMTLLQIYSLAAIVLPLASHAAPRGSRPYRKDECIIYAPGIFRRVRNISEPIGKLQIISDACALMMRSGLMVLSSLAQDTPCEYEEKLLNSLLVYGRACYQLDPSDKLLQVMTAVEMFTLRSDSEPIQATVSDRMAFAITDDPGLRQKIAQNLRRAYAARSSRSHHGKSITDTEIVEEFLCNARIFFLITIQGVGRYRTRLEFLEYLDRIKYGHK